MDFRCVGVMVADSVVVKLGEGIMWASEEGDEDPGETIFERQGGYGWRFGGAEEDRYE